ncbi:MAG: aldo/keto reductase [Actinomycetota bacterium]|nr:aldo/keto reductase [Actinomycetota bacterium]MDQ2957087.1 aldo/keto reductase [Actinomycetota bacterium]
MTYSFDPRSSLPLVLGGNVFGWSADRENSFAVLDAFLDAGGTQIDTADAYARWLPGSSGGESETILGEWLAARGNRDRVFLATKVGALAPLDNLRAETIATAIEDSLRRLQTDHLDLYWAHRDDENTPQEETLEAFDTLVRAGKVRYLGASNFSAERLQSALDISEKHQFASYVAVQPLYNLLEQAGWEDGAGQVALANNLATWPYSSLASGFLSGKYRRGSQVESVRSKAVAKYLNERGYQVIDAVQQIAEAHRVSIAGVALRWLSQQPGVLAPIASARNTEQLADLLTVADFTLSQDELDTLRAVASVR